MILGEIDVNGQWALALITDEGSIDLPALNDASVAATRSSILVSVIHPQEGTAHVTVSLGRRDREAYLVYSGELQLASGTLMLCTADFETRVDASVTPGTYWCEVFSDQPVHAERVSVVLTARPG